jgi:23S rRNA C2498 (ribose-2'-O)-methylase RlmM
MFTGLRPVVEKEVLTRKTVYVTLALHSMKNETKQDWIRDLKALAQRNYSTGYGWQVFVECYDTNEWKSLVADCETYEEAVNHATSIASIYQDQYNDACAEIL